MDVSSFWQQVLIGSIIVLAVYIDVLRRDIGNKKIIIHVLVLVVFNLILELFLLTVEYSNFFSI